jgi:hypothetical protein
MQLCARFCFKILIDIKVLSSFLYVLFYFKDEETETDRVSILEDPKPLGIQTKLLDYQNRNILISMLGINI